MNDALKLPDVNIAPAWRILEAASPDQEVFMIAHVRPALPGVFLVVLALSATDAAPPAPLAAGGPPDSLTVDATASRIQWRDASGHVGTVPVTKGMIVIRHERLTSATVDVDLRPARGAAALDIGRAPDARFVATGATRAAAATWRVDGVLTMGGAARPVSLWTAVRWEELGHMVATAELTIDPRRFGATDRRNGDLVVDVTLHARRIARTLSVR